MPHSYASQTAAIGQRLHADGAAARRETLTLIRTAMGDHGISTITFWPRSDGPGYSLMQVDGADFDYDNEPAGVVAIDEILRATLGHSEMLEEALKADARATELAGGEWVLSCAD